MGAFLVAEPVRNPPAMQETLLDSWASPMAQTVKNLPAMRKTWVQPLGQEDPLEEGMTLTLASLPGDSAWTEEPGGLQSTGSQSPPRLSN